MRLSAIAAYIVVIVAVLMLVWAYPAKAHDSWINTEHRTNAAGEWCCNAVDCKAVGFDEYLASPRGYTMTSTGEFIPHAETQPSSDQHLWICRRSDRTRRCVFAPNGGANLTPPLTVPKTTLAKHLKSPVSRASMVSHSD